MRVLFEIEWKLRNFCVIQFENELQFRLLDVLTSTFLLYLLVPTRLSYFVVMMLFTAQEKKQFSHKTKRF